MTTVLSISSQVFLAKPRTALKSLMHFDVYHPRRHQPLQNTVGYSFIDINSTCNVSSHSSIARRHLPFNQHRTADLFGYLSNISDIQIAMRSKPNAFGNFTIKEDTNVARSGTALVGCQYGLIPVSDNPVNHWIPSRFDSGTRTEPKQETEVTENTHHRK